MLDYKGDYISGYLERTKEGKYEGELYCEGISLSPICGVLFKKEGKTYLWLKRKDILVYDAQEQRYIKRKREPRWEAYLEKQLDQASIAYKGKFSLMRFRFSITGIWDRVFGRTNERLNFFVERLPMNEQDIINGYN